MTIIVEDGTGLADAESYASVAETDTYMSARGTTVWATLTTTEKEQALRRAMDYLLQKYRSKWKGARKSLTQALDWPRVGVFIDEDADTAFASWKQNQIPSNVIPLEVKNACMELALRASIGMLNEDQAQKVIQETVGPITTKYDQYSTTVVKYSQVTGYLAPYFKATTGGGNMKLVRV